MKTIYNNVLRLLLVALMAMPLLATAQEKLSGTGTAADPYLIGTAENLEEFASIVNANTAGTKKCARLTADIDYTGKTARIGTNSSYPYQGTFDGDNHTITVALGSNTTTTSCLALFTNISGNVEIKNLKVDGSVQSANVNAGGVVGKILSGATAKLTNVSSSVTITLYYKSSSYYGYQAGGVVGLVSGGATFNNVTSNAVISYSGNYSYLGKQSGGVVGGVKGSSGAKCTVTLTNVTSNAEITTLGQHAGGIVGFTDYAYLTIENSSSHAKITYTGTSNSYCGGIIGLAFESNVNNATRGTITIRNCAFSGSFEGGLYNGGLIGESKSNCSENVSIIVAIQNSYSYCKPVKGYHYGVFFGKCIELTGDKVWYVTNKVYNSYYLMPDDLDDLDENDIQFQGQGRSASQFKDGTICRLLNELNSSNTTWRQNFSGNVDPLPVTDPTHAEITWPSMEGYTYSQIFSELDIKDYFNKNAVRGHQDETPTPEFESNMYLYWRDGTPSGLASSWKYLPLGFTKTGDTIIKNFWGINTPFLFAWNGENGFFDGDDCLRFDSKNEGNNGQFFGEKTIKLKEEPGKKNIFKELYVCVTCGGKNTNTPALVTVVIKYKDETTQSTTFFVDDWYQPASNGYTATRYKPKENKAENGVVFCCPLNDALNTEKEIDEISFTNVNYQERNLKVGVFAITGLRLSEPKGPVEVTANINSDGTKMTLTWTKVTELVIDGVTPPENSISYVYDVATDKEFKHIVPGKESIPVIGTLNRGTYTAEIAGDFRNKFVRVRATNIVGQSLSTSAMVMPVELSDDNSDPDMQTKISDWKELGDNSETVDVKVMREFTNVDEYYTLCLPFDVSDEQIESELQGCSVYKYKQARINNGVLDIEFESATDIEAGVPYFIKWNGSVNVENPVFENVTVTREEPSQIVKEYATCKGTFVPTHLSSESGENENYLFLVGNNTLLWPEVGDPSDLKGLRAYFQITDSKVRYGMPTSIVDNPDADIEIEEPEVQKLYQNGRIVIIKDGVKYDLFGRVIE